MFCFATTKALDHLIVAKKQLNATVKEKKMQNFTKYHVLIGPIKVCNFLYKDKRLNSKIVIFAAYFHSLYCSRIYFYFEKGDLESEFGVSTTTIRKWLKQLSNYEFIKIYKKDNKKFIIWQDENTQTL